MMISEMKTLGTRDELDREQGGGKLTAAVREKGLERTRVGGMLKT